MYLLTEWRGCLDKNLAQEQTQQGLCIVTSKFSFHGSVNHAKFGTSRGYCIKSGQSNINFGTRNWLGWIMWDLNIGLWGIILFKKLEL